MTDAKQPDWNPPPQPDWLVAMNREGRCFDLPSVVPLDEQSLLDQARRTTGLQDFGDDAWREPFRVLLQALEEEAELTLMGRLMARSDIILWLGGRLQVIDILRQHPEIREQAIEAPMFVVGLPRSGTSILFELLAQDPDVGVPLMWEALQPCPPPEAATYATDPRIARAHDLFTQWSRVAPEFAAMHEMRGDIPAECGLLMAGTFVSDHIATLQQTPSYSAWCAAADYLPVYEWHRTILQILQWKNPRRRWLLKAPEHQVHLETLLQVYLDARIVQTHRDPLKCMASATSMMGTIYRMRSDQAFDSSLFESFTMGEPTARRLEDVMRLRDTGVVPAANITDSCFQELMAEPLTCIAGIYRHFGMELGEEAKAAMTAYLAAKPRGKFGQHDYRVDPRHAAEREHFRAYQARYGVPDEL